MKRENRIIQLRSQLDRTHDLLARVDVKGNLIMAYHSLVIGGVLINYSSIVKLINTSCLSFKSAVILLSAASLVSMYFAFRALFPFLRVGENDEVKSLIAFPGIAKIDSESFIKQIQVRKSKELEKDLITQIYSLSKTLNKKFNHIKWAGIICFAHLIIALILLIQHLSL